MRERRSRAAPWNMQSRRLVLSVLVATVVVANFRVLSADGRRQAGSLTLNQMVDQICVTDEVEPAYLVGKAFSALLGPAVMHSDINEDIPFLDETRKHQTYAQIPPLDRDSCRTVLGALHGQVANTVRHKRLLEIRQCTHGTIGRNASRPGINERWAWHVLDEVVSEMALSLDYNTTVICTSFQKKRIGIAFVRALGATLDPEEVEDDEKDAWLTCTHEKAAKGLCPDESSQDGLHDVPHRMKDAMTISMQGCNHVAWWLCKGASSVEQHMNADTFAVPVIAAAARFLGVIHEQIRWEGRHMINEAYRYILGRDADVHGYEQYARLVAVGVTSEIIRGHLMKSHEYIEYSRQMGFEKTERQVRTIFRDILLRQPEQEAIESYSLPLQQPRGAEKVRKILMASEEYQDLCLRSDRADCDDAKEAVRRVFLQLMGRPPDTDGLVSYTREIVLGHLTMDQIRDLLRESDEYRFGVKLKLQAREVVSRLQAFYPECRSQLSDGTDEEEDGGGSRLLGDGRWCSRGACEADSGASCSHWPLTSFRQVQAVAWGQSEVDKVAGRAVGQAGWEGSAEQRALAKATQSYEQALQMYQSVLGRYPSSKELVQQLRRLKDGAVSVGEVAEELTAMREEEVIEGAEERKWAHRMELMANLLHSINVALPEETQDCFLRGFMLEQLGMSFFCKHIDDHLLFDIDQQPPPEYPECLSGRASWTICSEGRWLCRPEPGVRPMEAVFDLAQQAEEHGVPGLTPSWVYFTNGSSLVYNEVCQHVGGLLVSMQETWNGAAPLFNPQPPPPQGQVAQVPIAIYVHQRPQYFQEVLKHLRAVRGIEAVPVFVISMDAVDADMLAIARSIDFVPFRIIFHPGRADRLRVQSVLAIKQHWMWLQDMLWTRLPETRRYHGHIALLEEDHVVTPDYLEVILMLLEMKGRECPRCWAVCVKYGCRDMADTELFKVCRTHSVMNTGIAFNRSTYEAIKASDFASFADGWDWSLFHLAQTGQMADMMLAPAVSRIRNIGLQGATVKDDGDDFLLHQLDYKDVGQHAAFQRDEFWIDKSVPMHYVPPAWEPLFLGLLGFIAT